MPQKPLQMPDLSSYRDLGEIFRSAVEERGKVAFFPVPEYPPTTEDERIAKLEARLEVLEEFITRNSFEARTGIKIVSATEARSIIPVIGHICGNPLREINFPGIGNYSFLLKP